MALALQTCTYLQQYVYSWLRSVPKKAENALKLGVLSSGSINAASIIHPAETHPDVILYAIACRDLSTAKSQARKYNFLKAYGSFEEMLQDQAIDIVYISLPNGMHYDWAAKALGAGKHVLLEKPLTSNAAEAKKLVSHSEQSGKILMEAFHWQFHPAAQLFKEILEDSLTSETEESEPPPAEGEERSGKELVGEGGGAGVTKLKLGKILKTHSIMTSTPELPAGDIRWQYDLAGGSLMDMAYVISFTRYILKAGSPVQILSAKAVPSAHDARVDKSMDASMLFRTNSTKSPDITSGVEAASTSKTSPATNLPSYTVHSEIYTDMKRSWAFHIIPRLWEVPSIQVETNKATVYFYNAMMPHLYHYISVKDKKTGKASYYKRYVRPKEEQVEGGQSTSQSKKGESEAGEPHWSTYRYQLEAFVDRVRGRKPAHWVTLEDSIEQMQTIDDIYTASGLPIRPTSISAV